MRILPHQLRRTMRTITSKTHRVRDSHRRCRHRVLLRRIEVVGFLYISLLVEATTMASITRSSVNDKRLLVAIPHRLLSLFRTHTTVWMSVHSRDTIQNKRPLSRHWVDKRANRRRPYQVIPSPSYFQTDASTLFISKCKEESSPDRKVGLQRYPTHA
jgi:hypothetical protein